MLRARHQLHQALGSGGRLRGCAVPGLDGDDGVHQVGIDAVPANGGINDAGERPLADLGRAREDRRGAGDEQQEYEATAGETRRSTARRWTGGRRWRCGTTRRRDRRGATAGRARPSLALAILLAVTDAATAERFYEQFKWSVIAPIGADRWALDAATFSTGWSRRRRGRTASCA